MFSKPTRNYKAVFSTNENKHAINHKLNNEIMKDMKMDFQYVQTDHTHASCISKQAIKRKNLPLQLEAGKISIHKQINGT